MNRKNLQRPLVLFALLAGIGLMAPGSSAQQSMQDSCSKHPCTGEVSINQPIDGVLQAANQDQQAASQDPQAVNQASQAANQDPQAAQPAPQTGFLNANYTVSLNGGAPISVQAPKHLHWLYAASTSQGYDSDIAGPLSNISTYTSVYEGYLGALWRFNQSYLLVQQDSAFTYYGSSLLQGSGFHQTAALSSFDLAPSLNLTLQGNSSIGNNTLTELIQPAQVLVNGIAVTSPVNATAGLNLGFVWGSDVVGTLNWKPDVRDLFSFRAENANHQYYGLDQHDNLATFKLTYMREVTENAYLGAYGLEKNETGTLFCDSYGFGLSAAVKPTNRLFLQAEGGPEFDSTGCFRHQGFELHFAGTYQLNRSSYLYALADRQLSSGFVPSSTWQDDAGLGFAKQLTRRLWWSVGGGYERGFIIPALTPYHGFYSQTELRHRLSNSFDLEGMYRRLDQSVPGLGLHRNIILFTLRWSPRSHDPGRTAMYQTSNDYRSGHDE